MGHSQPSSTSDSESRPPPTNDSEAGRPRVRSRPETVVAIIAGLRHPKPGCQLLTTRFHLQHSASTPNSGVSGNQVWGEALRARGDHHAFDGVPSPSVEGSLRGEECCGPLVRRAAPLLNPLQARRTRSFPASMCRWLWAQSRLRGDSALDPKAREHEPDRPGRAPWDTPRGRGSWSHPPKCLGGGTLARVRASPRSRGWSRGRIPPDGRDAGTRRRPPARDIFFLPGGRMAHTDRMGGGPQVTFGTQTESGTCAASSDGTPACRPSRPPPQGPPPEAIEACSGYAEGEACAVTLGGNTLDGVCEKGPRGGEPLACRPNRPPAPPSR